jgi:hypothetical protein
MFVVVPVWSCENATPCSHFKKKDLLKMFIRIAIFLLLKPAMGSTIPCPGVDDPNTFKNTPLSERPNLAKILQNGYMPSLNQATLPTTTPPGNPIQLSEGFITNRPFRTIDASLCHPTLVNPPDEFIRCVHSSSTSFESTNSRTFSTLLVEQVLLESTVEDESNYPTSDSFYNPSFAIWKENITAYLQSEFNCTDWGYLKMFLSSYSCAVSTLCQKLDQEFLDDLAALPISRLESGGENVNLYHDFTQKWGYGTVDRFKLGSANLELRSSVAGDDDGTILYMGRAGGRENLTNGDGYEYTAEECHDPEPVLLNYQRWDEFLQDNDFFFRLIAENDIANRTEIQDNFGQYYLFNSSDVFSQVYDQTNLTDTTCKTTESTAAPTSTSEPSSTSPSYSPAPSELTMAPVASMPPTEPSISPSGAPTEDESSTRQIAHLPLLGVGVVIVVFLVTLG